MARELSSTVREVFRGFNSYQRCYRNRSDRTPYNRTVKYMEVPVFEDTFELPLLALESFVSAVKQNIDTKINAIAVTLNSHGNTPRYKSVDRFMQDVLTESFKDSRLVLLEVKQGNNTLTYYGTHGAVFNKDFNPIMICSYKVQRFMGDPVTILSHDREITKYRFLRPLLRVSPKTFLLKSDPIEKFIVNKMINACLEQKVYLPFQSDLTSVFEVQNDETAFVKVEIDDFPFMVHQADCPSISTSNQQLLQLAIDHIDELIQ